MMMLKSNGLLLLRHPTSPKISYEFVDNLESSAKFVELLYTAMVKIPSKNFLIRFLILIVTKV